MKEKDDSSLIEVFTGSPWEAELIRGLLESNGLQATTKDGMMESIAPYIGNGMVVMVNEEDYEPAMQVIRQREETKGE